MSDAEKKRADARVRAREGVRYLAFAGTTVSGSMRALRSQGDLVVRVPHYSDYAFA